LLDFTALVKLVWPNAQHAWGRLDKAKANTVFEAVTITTPAVTVGPARHKRQADDAFGTDKSSNYRDHHRDHPHQQHPGTFAGYEHDDSTQIDTNISMSTRLMAHMLGLTSAPSYASEYEWWAPRMKEEELSPTSSTSSMNTNSISPTESTFNSQGPGIWLHDIPNIADPFSLPPNSFGI
jgi:hypothetical protein